MAKKIFSFDDVEVHEKTVDTLAKYKGLLEQPFADALKAGKMAEYAARIHKEVATEDRQIVIAFVNMVTTIHMFTMVGGE